MPDPQEVDSHLDRPEPLSLTDRLAKVLARHEAAGHLTTVALTAIAPRLTPGDEQLATTLDQATQKLRPGNRARARVSALFPAPAELISDNMRAALAQRQELIETDARRLLQGAEDAGAAWVARIGPPSSRHERREQWEAHAATVALYRYRYDITDPAPMGYPNAVRGPDHAAEYRRGRFALRHIKASVRHDDDRGFQPTDRTMA